MCSSVCGLGLVLDVDVLTLGITSSRDPIVLVASGPPGCNSSQIIDLVLLLLLNAVLCGSTAVLPYTTRK